ncbi:hypothetical protein BA950_15250 [Erythrobacter sp. SAORIC-644]|uniref:OmpW/AlkL family protein n=1 Tax=Erythrobacter sp. SAORIC-644 TaxID=1869314 RepID=UPI000C9F052B|nr:OmpW family outer membrane protein [Erythrobacter sp. SAORIC-644]PNQ74138.1 hypothetical protein BA950_15250 [Erythrobacter sp. SAORIC-644]
MNKLLMAVLTSAAMFATPAQAQDDDRNLQVKLLGTYVAPDGKITEFRTDVVGLPATTQTKANDNIVPTLAVEYFVKPKFSVETICCLTQHDVDGVTGVPGAELVSKAKLIPATLTAKYHFGAANVRPYLGLEPDPKLSWVISAS